jgi:hypothetical protein
MGDDLIANRPLLWVLVGLCSVWPAAATAQSAARALHADRFDVALTLLADGSVDVRETMVFRFSGRGVSRVEREIPTHRFDGVIDVRASIDGRPAAPGLEVPKDGQAERVRIRQDGDWLRVTWTFPETIDQTRTFTLEYRAMGALSVANGRATMDWIVLPLRHRYLIDEARVEWRVPAAAVRVEPTSLDDPRWTSTAMPDGWAATRQGIGTDETVRLSDAFDLTTMALAVPVWQANAFRARQMAPAFVITAMTLLVVGAGVVGMTWFRYHLPAREPSIVEPAAADALPPAMGTALVRGSVAIGLPQMQATLLDLARRAVLQIAESPGNAKHFQIIAQRPSLASPRDQARPAKPHEQAIEDTLWLHMKDGRVELRSAWRHLKRTLPAFRRSVLAEMQEAGLVDAERRWAARGMSVAGIVVTLLGIASFVIFRIAFGHLGDVPLVVPASIVIDGFVFIIAGQVMSVLSAAGAVAAAQWRARRAWIKSSMKAPMSAADVAHWLPVAAGFGLARRMLKASNDPVAERLARIIAATPTASPHRDGGAS